MTRSRAPHPNLNPHPDPAIGAGGCVHQGRPAYHYAPRANWLSDPNGLVWHQGLWHLFYQYNPHNDDWGHMSWGHATSSDLAQWQEQPVALPEDDAHMMFSGCAVIDAENCAGFGAGAMLAFYTGAGRDAGAYQSQCLAVSQDAGQSFAKYAGNPVLCRRDPEFRDPNIFWHAPSGRWIMVTALSHENRALIHGSVDLKHWTELSAIGPIAWPGRVWECPMLIELPVEGSGGATRWAFKVDLLFDAQGSGAMVLVGDFDGTRFVPDRDADGVPDWHLADHGRDFYAAVPWHDPRDGQGRPAWIGWMGNHAYQKHLPPRGWRGAMSLPRRLSLRRTDNGYRLVQSVEQSVDALFEPLSPVGATAKGLPTALRIDWPQPTGRLIIASGTAQLIIDFDHAAHLMRVQRGGDMARKVGPVFAQDIVAPRPGEGAVQIWLDHASIEIIGDDGAFSLTAQHVLPDAPLRLDMIGVDTGNVRLSGLRQ